MLLKMVLGCLALLSLVLTLWQWFVGRRFPLHQRLVKTAFAPAITILKPLKGCEAATEECLRSWFLQNYIGSVQLLFGVAAADDPVCGLVRRLLQEFPGSDTQLVICGPPKGANLKVSQLMDLEGRAKHDVLVISDADVRVPSDLLANAVAPLQSAEVALVSCFYRLANPSTLAMEWEGIAVNADFWSQALQAQTLKPLDFALGAVMATKRQQLNEIGGFAPLKDCLADDYELGHRLARKGYRIVLSTLVVECWSEPMGWAEVWQHQIRWARTIRVCQPVPYFFSILSNATLWPFLWLAADPGVLGLVSAGACWGVRIVTAFNLEQRFTRGRARWHKVWLVPLKDVLQAAIWLLAFLGNRIEWRGEQMRLRRDGTLVKPNVGTRSEASRQGR